MRRTRNPSRKFLKRVRDLLHGDSNERRFSQFWGWEFGEETEKMVSLWECGMSAEQVAVVMTLDRGNKRRREDDRGKIERMQKTINRLRRELKETKVTIEVVKSGAKS